MLSFPERFHHALPAKHRRKFHLAGGRPCELAACDDDAHAMQPAMCTGSVHRCPSNGDTVCRWTIGAYGDASADLRAWNRRRYRPRMVLLALLLAAQAPQAGGLSWNPPAAWPVEPPRSAMRLATYRVPAAAGDAEPAELGVFFFGSGEGGSVDANVERWIGQFTPEMGAAKPTRRVETVNGIRVTRVSTEGTYASGMPGGPTTPKTHFALVGAIAEGPGGNVFFKLTGPRKTVSKAAAQFEALVRSLKRA